MVIILTLLVLLSACNRQSQPVQARPESQLAALLAELTVNTSKFDPPEFKNSSADLLFQPDSQTESLLLQALITVDGTKSTASDNDLIAVMVHIDRLSLLPESDSVRTDSAWNYSSVLRSHVAVDIAPDMNNSNMSTDSDSPAASRAIQSLRMINPRQSIQRQALYLAGAQRHAIWVGADKVDIALLPANKPSCSRDYHWQAALSENAHLDLSFSLSVCPAMQFVGDLITWQVPGFTVSGHIIQPQEHSVAPISMPVSGHGWLRRSHGSIPRGFNAPVVIDSMRLRFDDGRLLNVTRSKRRSGNGPKTVAATIQTSDGIQQQLAMTWQDSQAFRHSQTGRLLPEIIKLAAPDAGIDIAISPINQLLDAPDPAVSQVETPVLISGNRDGSGFITYVTVQPAQ